MKKKDKKIMVFLNKYQQRISSKNKFNKSKKIHLCILSLGCIVLFSFIVNVYSSKTFPPQVTTRESIAYDSYPSSPLEIAPTYVKKISFTDPPGESPRTYKEIIPEKQQKIKSNQQKIKKKNDLTYTGFIKKNDSLWTLLRGKNINPSVIHAINKSSKKVYNLNRLRQGELFILKFNEENELETLQLETRNEKVVTVTYDKEKNSYTTSVKPFEYDIKIESISGEVKGSFFEAVFSKGENSTLASAITNIFEWQIDFVLDLRRGDTFKALFEKKYRKGKFLGYGKIFGAEFINNKKKYSAILFTDSNGVENYYNSEGKSLRKQFLKSPLRYTRISSGFSRKRFHPILKRYMPHLGIDYAAPRGTPIRAIGDGKVIWARRKGPNGNLVLIKHNSIYTSAYSHLSRYGKKIKKGTNVKQGQVIGYVGSTGRSTGPHLDFHIKKYGRDINPLKLKIPSARSVSKKEMPRFNIVKKMIMAKIRNINTDIIIAEKN